MNSIDDFETFLHFETFLLFIRRHIGAYGTNTYWQWVYITDDIWDWSLEKLKRELPFMAVWAIAESNREGERRFYPL